MRRSARLVYANEIWAATGGLLEEKWSHSDPFCLSRAPSLGIMRDTWCLKSAALTLIDVRLVSYEANPHSQWLEKDC